MKTRRVQSWVLVLFYALVPAAHGQRLNDAYTQSSVLLHYDVDSRRNSWGSGFLVFHECKSGLRLITPDGPPTIARILLITNKHVLPPEDHPTKKLVVRLHTDPSPEDMEMEVIGENGKYLPLVQVHAVSDVAVIDISTNVAEKHFAGGMLSDKILASKEQMQAMKLGVGDELFIIGFPDAIFDPRNASPLLRMGVIATDPLLGWAFNDRLRTKYNLPEKINGFLIDANVFPGSSGSMVVLRPGIRTTGGGVFEQSNVSILGIVSMSIPIEDAAIGTVQRMGLGVVYSSEEIIEVIRRFHFD